jgi:SAM-dependent methyltransferase
MHNDFIAEAKTYWRFVPGGEGKIDTLALLDRSNDDFLDVWRRNKTSRRQTYWEESHFIAHFARMAEGKKVLSFGCGLAYSETEFLDRGAFVTFADIVSTNIDCVRRLCRLLGYDRTSFMLMDDSSKHPLGGPYDYIFAYGSLMCMPEEDQARTLRNFAKALAPGGMVLLMLYTPEFVKSSQSSFDNRIFARAADESVGSLHCPWSDWHDDEKIQRLAPDFTIIHSQLWNEDRYVWYCLTKKDGSSAPAATPFIDLARAEEAGKVELSRTPLQQFEVCDASAALSDDGSLRVTTFPNNFHYAVAFPQMGPISEPATLVIEIDVVTGGASVGLLDVATDHFVMSKAITQKGRRQYYVDLDSIPTGRLIVSNFRPQHESASEFVIHALRLLIRA